MAAPPDDIFDTLPRDGGAYVRTDDGRWRRVEAATRPAEIGATHRQRREAADGTVPPGLPEVPDTAAKDAAAEDTDEPEADRPAGRPMWGIPS